MFFLPLSSYDETSQLSFAFPGADLGVYLGAAPGDPLAFNPSLLVSGEASSALTPKDTPSALHFLSAHSITVSSFALAHPYFSASIKLFRSASRFHSLTSFEAKNCSMLCLKRALGLTGRVFGLAWSCRP